VKRRRSLLPSGHRGCRRFAGGRRPNRRQLPDPQLSVARPRVLVRIDAFSLYPRS